MLIMLTLQSNLVCSHTCIKIPEDVTTTVGYIDTTLTSTAELKTQIDQVNTLL